MVRKRLGALICCPVTIAAASFAGRNAEKSYKRVVIDQSLDPLPLGKKQAAGLVGWFGLVGGAMRCCGAVQ